jgi:hypothetical protein
MPALISYSLSHHPAQSGESVALWKILYGVFVGAIAWAGHLIANFAVSVHACYPGDIPLARSDSGADWAWPLILGFDLISLAVIASGFWISYRVWVRSGKESSGDHHHLIEVGEGRTRFLGIVGMAFSVTFLFITITDTIGLGIVPICPR